MAFSFPTSNNASESKNDDEILTVLEPANSRGLLPREQGMYFYCMYGILGLVAAKRVNVRRRAKKQKLVNWNIDLSTVPTADRLVVAAEILANHQYVLTRLRRRGIQLELIGREIQEPEFVMMEHWKFHIVDDFVVVGHTPRGAVFVQVTNDGKENVFIVRGLADKIGKICNPSVFNKAGMKYGVFHTALVPSPDGNAITYVGALVGGGSFEFRVRTAKYMDELFERVAGAYERARISGSIHYTLINKPTLVTSPTNEGLVCNSSDTMANADLRERPKKTIGCRLNLALCTWSTTRVNTRWMENQKKFFDTLTSPEKFEGFKTLGMADNLIVKDDDVCPFCYGFGPASELTTHVPSRNVLINKGSIDDFKPFSRCCKKYYLSRCKRNAKKQLQTIVMYNPVPKHVVEQIVHPYLELTGQPIPKQMEIQRYGFQEIRQISVSLPSISEVNILRQRLNEHDGFHPTIENKWDFVGFLNMILPQGAITYGDISIRVEAMSFNCEAMTFGRAEILIKEMEFLCTGLHPYDACIFLSKNRKKQKVDSETDSKIRKLIESWMDNVGSDIKSEGVKKEYWDLACSYCGARKKKLQQCTACKEARYCGRECQKKHWKNHKVRCKKIQKAKQKRDEKREKKNPPA